MASRAAAPADQGAGAGEAAGTSAEFRALRSLIVGPERADIDQLRERLDDPDSRTADVASVLPQAMLMRARDPDIARTLSPIVEHSITSSVQRNPQPLADALFPVMGPAIRKAVAASLSAMVESLNRTLEHSVSARSLGWRIEALRTGRSFGEVALLHTLLFRVEQVFLIERESGLLLQHVQASGSTVQDADMVSGMLTAIREFARDSFRVDDSEGLEALRVGDLSVLIEQGPHAILAAVVRGTPPPEFRQTLQHALESIHLQHGDALASFAGDASPFEACRPDLEACLATQYRSEESRRSRRLLWILAIALALAAVVWAGFVVRRYMRWSDYLAALRAEPGVVVVSAERTGGRYVVTGLRDPLARNPALLQAAARLEPSDVETRWEAYHALHPDFVLARAQQILRPAAGISLSLTDGVLSASGTPTAAWIADATRLAALIPGVTRFDAVPPLDASIAATSKAIGETMVRFEKGTANVAAGDQVVVRQLAAQLAELNALAILRQRRFTIEITGHADSDGDANANQPLSEARAASVLAGVSDGSFRALDVVARGAGSREPLTAGQSDDEKQRNRRAALRVVPAPTTAREDERR